MKNGPGGHEKRPPACLTLFLPRMWEIGAAGRLGKLWKSVAAFQCN